MANMDITFVVLTAFKKVLVSLSSNKWMEFHHYGTNMKSRGENVSDL